jgi:MFS family permease
MPFLPLFAIGINLPTLEFHMLSYDIKEKNIGFWFSLYTVGYIASSLILSRKYTFNKFYIILSGSVLMGIGYTLLGPSPLLFDRNFKLFCIGLIISGVSSSMIYGISYIVPSIPYIISIAHNDYMYEEDHRLYDAITGLINVSMSLGEVLGPIVGSSLKLSYEQIYAMVGFLFFTFSILYFLINNHHIKSDNSSTKSSLIELKSSF